MLDQQDRHARVALATDDLHERLALGGVEAGGRLVEDQQLPTAGQRAGERDAFLDAKGQALHRMAGVRSAVESIQQRQRVGASRGLSAAGIRQLEREGDGGCPLDGVLAEHDVLERAHAVAQLEVLERATDAQTGDSARACLQEVVAGEAESPRGWGRSGG